MVFKKGQSGNPKGRPPESVDRRRSYLCALSDEVSLDDWKEIAAHAKADALKGDAKARQWLSDYLIGKDPHAQLLVTVDDKRTAFLELVTVDTEELANALDVEAEAANDGGHLDA
jgi:hypothetical protein